jgi:VIT1/CCC1 family predicted Fe2+/Mn2+ transporter
MPTIIQTDRILLPREQVAMPIPVERWDMLASRLESCKADLRLWSLASLVAFFVGVVSALFIIPIAFFQLPKWILTTCIVFCALGLAAWTVLVIAERALARHQSEQIDRLISDMRASFTKSTI